MLVRCGCLLWAMLILGTDAQAQLLITESTSAAAAATMVQNMFAGNCVTISNVTYTGYATTTGGGRGAIGSFVNGSTTNMDLDEGFLLTSGRAMHALGPDNTDNLSFNNGQVGDADLTLVTGISTYDAAIVQFDFVPFSDTVKFRYVFASEEYPEYVDGGFNDVFGFFITGPGYSGPFQNGGQNVALVPGTNIPVAIDNVNNGYSGSEPSTGPCDNCAYYVDNSSGATIQYDGFTHALTVNAVVQRCQTYHIKLAITDVGDRVLDSGVFFESRSFNAGEPIQVSIEANTASSGVYEGCSDLLFAFTRVDPTTINNPIFVDFIVGGTATEGVDFATLPNIVTIPAGQMSATMLIDAFTDATSEPTESITISLDNAACGCGPPPSATVNVFNNDVVLSATSTGSTVVCPGGTATLTATPAGSEGPYSIAWDNGAGNGPSVNVSPATTTVYTGTINDICFGQTVTVQETVTVLQGGFAINGASPQCLVGNSYGFTPAVAGPGINHVWDFGDGGPISISASPTHSYQNPGNFTITHTINNGVCTATSNQAVVVQPGVDAVLSAVVPVSCAGLTDGSATITVNGGIGPFTYLWAPGGQTTATVSGMAAGSYSVQISGSSGCDAVLPVVILDGESPVASCADATIQLPISGTATLQPQAFFTGNAANCAIASISISPNVFDCSNLGPQAVTLTILDNLGASTTCNSTLTVADTLAPTVNCQGLTIALSGASITLDPAQLTTSATDNCGTVTLSASPSAFFCAFSDPQPVTVTATDANGNQSTCVSQVTVTGSGALGIATTQIVAANCNGSASGSATVSVNGGTAPFNLVWNNGQTGATATGLLPGTIGVDVTDANGCATSATVTIPLATGPQVALTLDTVYACNGAVAALATVVPAPAQGVLGFLWDDGSTTISNATLIPGNHSVTISNALGCDTLMVFDVLPRDSFALSLVGLVNLSCNASGDGSISVLVNGGSLPISFVWDDGQTAPSATLLAAGQHFVDVTDALGCALSDTFQLTEPQAINISILSQQDVTCFGSADGAAIIVMNGGIGPYSVLWQPTGAVGPAVGNLPAGSNQATVTDANGCTQASLVTIGQPAQIDVTVTPESSICAGQSIALSAAAAGIGPYTYNWNHNVGAGADQTVNPSATITYTVTAIATNGCTGTAQVTVNVVAQPQASFSFTQSDPCTLPAVFTLDGSATVADAIDWDFGNGNQATGPNAQATYPLPGSYTITQIATTGGLCADTTSQTVTVIEVPVPIGLATIPVGCDDLTITFESNSTGAVSIVWDFGDDSTSVVPDTVHTYVLPSTYVVTLTAFSPAGCSISTELPEPIVLLQAPVAAFIVLDGGPAEPTGTYYFINTSTQANQYVWDFGDGQNGTIDSPVHSYATLGDYDVILVADNGMNCPDTARFEIRTIGATGLFVPTALVIGSTDESGLFLPKGTGLKTYAARIFDEWGNVLWESSALSGGSPSEGWDGTYKGSIVPQGGYVWRVEATYINDAEWEGSIQPDGTVSSYGTVTVIY